MEKIFKKLLTWSIVLMMFGCSSGGGGSTAGGGGGGGDPVSNAGGTGTQNGIVYNIPAGAVDSDVTTKLQLTTEDVLPGTAPTGAAVASKTLVVTTENSYQFYEPIKLTMPYETTNLGADDFPGVFYWDADANLYRSVGVKDIDTAAKTITFSTVHSGKYVALGIKGLAADLGLTGGTVQKRVASITVDTKFAPATDGFFHPNFGAYDSPGGSCLGMANFAVWYYSTAKSGNNNTGLYSMYKEGDVSRWEDDLTARELISRAFMSSSQSWAKSWMQKEYKLGPQMTGYFMILGLKLTGPMTFLMADQWPGMNSGHATVVYKYDSGKFYIYDVNFPGEEVTIDWGKDAATGKYKFTNYTKNAAYNPPFTQFSFEGLSSAAEASQYRALFDGAKSGWAAGNSKFNTISITSANDSQNKAVTIAADGTIQLAQEDTLSLNGTVTGGIMTAKFLHISLNGKYLGWGTVSGNAFGIQLPKITNGSNTLTLIATDDKADMSASSQ